MTIFILRIRVFIFFIGLFTSFQMSFAQSSSKTYQNELSILSENDAYLWFSQDRYYTNGFHLQYRHLLNSSASSPIIKQIVSLEFGQAIYNPYSAFVRDTTQIDRPFAGWLYGEFNWNIYSKNEKMWKFGLLMGTIGQASQAENIQKWYHEFAGFDAPVGWQTQIRNEFGLNLHIERLALIRQKIRKSRRQRDIFWQNIAYLGNTFTRFSSGLLFRFGSLESLNNSITGNSRLSNENQSNPQKEFFFFLKPMLNFIIYDATMQGGMFNRNSPFVKSPSFLVLSTELGLAYAHKKWSFDLTYTLKTRESRAMSMSSYGGIRLGCRF